MLKKYQLGMNIPLAGTGGETIEEIEAVQPAPIEPIEDLSEFIGPLSDIASSETTQVAIPSIPNNLLVDAENMDVTEFFNTYGKLPQEVELEAMSQEKVPMERYDTPTSAPNIYRENLSKVMFNGMSVEECAAGMHHALRSENTTNRISHDYRKNVLGISGNAWHTGKNIISHGGERIYGLHGANTDVSSARTNSGLRSALISNRSSQDLDAVLENMRVGDVVEMFYPGSGSQNDAFASGNEVHTTHIGMVSVDADGNKYVTHNIHGTWHTDDASKLLKRSNGYFIAGIVRPAYTQETSAVKISDGSMHYRRASGKTTAIERTPEERQAWEDRLVSSGRKSRIQPFLNGMEYYAPYIQEDTGVSNEDMANLVMPVSYALYGLESGFNNPESDFGEKAPFRNFWRSLKENGRPLTQSIGLGDLGGRLDPMSEGPTQIKLGQGFPASDPGKAFMERYGVDEETIYDPSVAASITQMLTIHNMNHLKSVIGASRFNALPIETKRNLLFKAHNKGIENVIKKDLAEKVGEDEYKLTPESIDAGLKIYSNLHIVSPEPYTNNGNDYALEISIDYDKVLAQHEEAARMGYNVRPYATAVEMAEQAYGDAKSTVEASAYSALQDGKNQLQNIQSQSKKAAKQGYTTLNNEIKKKLLTPAEAAGEKAFANMMTLGTIAGERGEQLQKELATPINETTQERIQRVSKALEHDIDNYTRETYDTLDSLDVPEAVSRKTPVGKIISKVTEINNATDSIPEVMASNPEIVREFNEAMDSVGQVLPFSVQAEILNDPRVLSGAITVEQRIQEELSGEPIEEAIENVEDLPVDSLPDLEYLQRNQDMEELVNMRDGGYLPKYQDGTDEEIYYGKTLPMVTVAADRPDTIKGQVGKYIDNPEYLSGRPGLKRYVDEYNIHKQNPNVVGSYTRQGLDALPTTSLRRRVSKLGIEADPSDIYYAPRSEPRTIDISGPNLSFARSGEVVKGQTILGGDFIEDEPTGLPASSYRKSGAQRYGSHGKKVDIDPETQEYYGVVNNKLKVGRIGEFSDKDVVVPIRWGGDYDLYEKGESPEKREVTTTRSTSIPIIHGLASIPTGEKEVKEEIDPLFTKDGEYVYSNAPEGKVIVHSPSTGQARFLFGYDKEGMFAESQKFKKEYPDAKFITVDTGRFNVIADNPEGLTPQNFIDYSKSSYPSPVGTAYNLIYNPQTENKQYGGYLPKYQGGTSTLNSPYFRETNFFTDEEKKDMIKSGQRVLPSLGPIDFNSKSNQSFTKEDWDRIHEDKRSRVEKFLGTETYNRVRDRPEFKGENVAEVFDPFSSSSWNDGLQAHDQWHRSGRTYPTLDEAVEMFGVIPMIGKAKFGITLAKGVKGKLISAGKKIRDVSDNLQSAINKGDAGRDIYEEDLPSIESIQPTKPETLSKEVEKILPKYQDGTDWFSKGWNYLFGDDEPEVKSINTDPTPAEVRAKQDSTARAYFKNYLREEEARPSVMATENSAIRKPGGGYYKKREDGIFYPYKLDKENKYTIGYGHSKKGVENFTKGITKEQAERFLEEDIDIAMRRTKEYVDNNPASPFYSDTTRSFETLPPQTQYMLADYPFNIGKLSKFKKYAGAVLSGDTAEAKLQYKRYANKDINQPLGRNKGYYDAYIEPWLETYRK